MSFMFFVMCTLCAENIDYDRRMQYELITKVFANFTPNFMTGISLGQPIEKICEWRRGYRFAVECENQVIRELNMNSCAEGDVEIEYLPNSLRILRIVHSGQNYNIRTRLLPRNARSIELQQNRIYGEIDLRTLPRNLETMNLSQNEITGPIELTSLPQFLRWIDLRDNRIEQRLVCFDILPDTIEKIDLTGNAISRVWSYQSAKERKKYETFVLPNCIKYGQL